MKKFLLITTLFTFILGSVSFAENPDHDVLSYYPYIQEIHNGPIIWHIDTSNPYNLGVRYRAVIFRQEIYYGLIVETYQVAAEGGFEFQYHKMVNFDVNRQKIEFISWITPKAFQIKIGTKLRNVEISEAGEIIVNTNK